MNKIHTIEEIKTIASPIAKQYGVKKLALFGSYARKEQSEQSDMDFIIDKGAIRGLLQFCNFINDLEDALEVSVDILTYEALKDSLISDSIHDEVILYEK